MRRIIHCSPTESTRDDDEFCSAGLSGSSQFATASAATVQLRRQDIRYCYSASGRGNRRANLGEEEAFPGECSACRPIRHVSAALCRPSAIRSGSDLHRRSGHYRIQYLLFVRGFEARGNEELWERFSSTNCSLRASSRGRAICTLRWASRPCCACTAACRS